MLRPIFFESTASLNHLIRGEYIVTVLFCKLHSILLLHNIATPVIKIEHMWT